MAKGYILRTPKQNGGMRRHGVTVVNPTPRGHSVRYGRMVSILPRATGYEQSHAAWENPGRSQRTARRRSGQYARGRTATGSLVANIKAGSTARRRKTGKTVSGRVVSAKKTSKRATRNPTVRSGTRRSRPQSRTTARTSRQVAAKKRKPARAKKGATKRIRVRKPGGRGYYLRRLPKKTRARRAAPKRRVTTRKTSRRAAPKRRAVRRTTRTGRVVRNPTDRWMVDVHPGTGERGIMGRPMTLAERSKWTRRGQVRAELKQKRAQMVRATPVKKRAQAVGAAAGAGMWRQGVIHPVSKKPVGGTAMSARDKKLFKSDGTARKGVGPATILKAYGLAGPKAPAKPKTRRTAVKKPRKAAKRRVRRAGAKRVRVYRKGLKGGRSYYLRKAPKKARKAAARKPAKRAVRRLRVKASKRAKSYLRRYPKRRRARKAAKRTVRRAVGRYRVKGSKRAKSYLRRYPKRRRVARKPAKRAVRRAVGRYRVKGSKRAKGYLRRYPKRRRAAKKAIVVRKTGRYRVKKHGGGTYLRHYPKRGRGRRAASRSITVRVPAKRSRSGRIVRKGYTYKRKARAIARNPYKRSRVRVKPYSYTRHAPKRRRVKVHGYKRSQWYPHSYEGRWISQARSKSLGLLTKREMAAMARRHGMRANPGAMALPTGEQLMALGKAAGVGFLGFGGAVAVGRALSGVQAIYNVAGDWTSVLGNLAAGLGFWALSEMMPENEKLQQARPYVMAGVGVAALVNIVTNLVRSRTIPSDIGAWLLPGGAPAPAIVPTSLVTNGAVTAVPAATSGLGQIDIYEAALDGVSGIEEELEMELNRMSGLGRGDGIFGDAGEGIFSGLDGTGTPVRQAYAGTGEYLETPMGAVEVEQAYAGVPVEQAYAGMGEYFRAPMSGMGEYFRAPMNGMGEYFRAPMSGMGATVEEAFAGMGQDPAEIEQSLKAQPLMPGFRAAVQKLVRDRVAAGQPLDDAFYSKLGKAAASLASRKFQQRVQQLTSSDVPTTQPKPMVTVDAVPNYRIPIGEPGMIPGEAEDIEDYEGKGEDEGIFTGGEDEGIF